MTENKLYQLIEQQVGKVIFENENDKFILNESASKTILSTQIQEIMYSIENDVQIINDSDEEDDLYNCISYLKKAKKILESLGL